MLIHELARNTGISAKTIRYYESIGLIPQPERGANNYRQYTIADVERLRFIASLRSLGFSISEIGGILAARTAGVPLDEQTVTRLGYQLSRIDQQILDLLAFRETFIQLCRNEKTIP